MTDLFVTIGAFAAFYLKHISNMKTRISFSIFLTIALRLHLMGQGQPGFVSFHFHSVFPVGSFSQAYDHHGLGAGADFYFRIHRKQPFYSGFNLSVDQFERYRLTSPVTLPGGFVQNSRLRASSNIFTGYLALRWMPDIGYIKPYVEGLAGFHNYYASVRLSLARQSFDDWSEVNRDTRGDWTAGFGGSAGLMIFLEQYAMAVDLKCTYMAGANVTHHSLKDDIDQTAFLSNAFSAFDEVRSVSQVLIPQIGLSFFF